MTRLLDLWRNARVRHVAFAAAIACLLAASGFISPLASFIWMVQARVHSNAPSGSVVFVGAPGDLADPASPVLREQLADLIRKLAAAKASRVIVDEVFESPSTIAADDELASALRTSPNVYLVRRHMTTLRGEETFESTPMLSGSTTAAISKVWIDPFWFIWRMPLAVRDRGQIFPSLPSAIAGTRGDLGETFQIDYSISYSEIPSLSMQQALELLNQQPQIASRAFEGKAVVVGVVRSPTQSYAIPGHAVVPRSIVSILAAETLIAGLSPEFGWFVVLVFTVSLLMLLAIKDPRPRNRHLCYILICLSQVVLFSACVIYRSPANLSASLVFLAIFGLIRLWVARQRASAIIDETTGLPTFKALERDLGQHGAIQTTTVVVAKVHHFDEVLSALPADKHAEYIRLIADRLRITQPDLNIYTSGGRYLAWMVQDHGDARLEAHLKGLRAVLSAPLTVSGVPVDAVITFGIDSTSESSAVRKIASATTAADKTSESLAPIRFADATSEADRMWNISLQAKIDEALLTGQIYVVYQPQIDLRTGRLLGAEALVRWDDPERGSISPSYFIAQCEQAGRMEALTRKVIGEALHTLAASPLVDREFGMSINVSATLLTDHRVAEIVEQTLSEVEIEPSKITLEITETARIVDYDRARVVMERLQRIGVLLSIDDFGVGSASLETFHALPFDELKIDRGFVATISADEKSRRIIESLIKLGESLNISVVAEGVEDAEIAAILTAAGCRIAQGYLFGRPGEFSELLAYDAAQKSGRAGAVSLT